MSLLYISILDHRQQRDELTSKLILVDGISGKKRIRVLDAGATINKIRYKIHTKVGVGMTMFISERVYF
jgi:hypothetical protein